MTNEIIIGDKNVTKCKIGKKNDLVYIGGPCAIENRDHTLFMADNIFNICKLNTEKYS